MNTILWIDRFLCRSLNLLILFIFCTFLLFLGVMTLPSFYAQMLEYQESLWDLSNFEIGYFVLITALTYRHISYCIKYKVDYWKAITRPIYALGYLTFTCLALVGLVELSTIYSAENIKDLTPNDVFGGPNGTEQMAWMILISLAVYLSTPTESETKTTQESPASNFGHTQSADAGHHQEGKSI